MKKNLNSLGMSVLIISLLFLIGCTKGGVVIPNPPNPLEPRVPQFSFPNLSTLDTVFFGKSVDFSYSVTEDATSLKINDSIVPLSGVFKLSNLKASTALTFVATYDKSRKTVERYIPIPVFDEHRSILMFIPPGKTGVWYWKSGRSYINNNWYVDTLAICQPTLFKRNGYSTWLNGVCNAGQPNSESVYSLSENGKTILWNGVTYSIVFLNDTTLTRSFTNNMHQTLEETFVKR